MLLHTKLFAGGRMPLRMARKRQTMPLAVEHQHRRRMNSTCKKWNFSLKAHSVFHARYLLHKSESLQQVFTVFSPTARGKEKFVQIGLHMCSKMTKEPCEYFLPPCHHPPAALDKRRQRISRSHFNLWSVMDAFIWPLAEKTECWIACPSLTEEENCTALSEWSERHARHVLQPQWTSLDHPVAIDKTVNGQYYCSLLQQNVRRALRHRQPELLESGVILLQEDATPHRHRDVQNLVQQWGWEVFELPPYSPGLAPCDYRLFALVKEHLPGKRYESGNNINTAVIASLHRLSKDDNKAAVDRLPHRWENSVDSAGDYVTYRTYV